MRILANGVAVERTTDYPIETAVFTGGTDEARVSAAMQFVSHLNSVGQYVEKTAQSYKGVPVSVNVRQDAIYITPRSRVRSDLFPGGTGWLEVAGVIYYSEAVPEHKKLNALLKGRQTEEAAKLISKELKVGAIEPAVMTKYLDEAFPAAEITKPVRSELRTAEATSAVKVQPLTALTPAQQTAAMEAAIRSAAKSTQELQFGIMKETEILSPEALKVDQAVINSVMKALGVESIPAYADQTRILMPYDLDLIKAVRYANPKAVVTVVVADAATRDLAEKNPDIAGINVIMNADLDVTMIARGEAAEIGITALPAQGASKSVVQLLKPTDAMLTKSDLRAAALVGQMGGVVAVIGFRKAVKFATQLSVTEILGVAIQAAQSLAKSA